MIGRPLAPMAAIAILSCRPAEQAPVTVSDAIVTLPAVPGRPGAAYFTLEAAVDDVRLVAISSPAAGRIELHETMQHRGMSRMSPLRSLPLGRDPVRFAPGGRHAMLFDVRAEVGRTVPLVFRFEGAPELVVQAEVRAPGDVAR